MAFDSTLTSAALTKVSAGTLLTLMATMSSFANRLSGDPFVTMPTMIIVLWTLQKGDVPIILRNK